MAGRFVTPDITRNHFLHFREVFETHGIPEIVYTDGLSLFGPSSSNDRSDPKSQFQRCLRGIGVNPPCRAQAKGKVERRFGTLQKRLVTLMAHAKVKKWSHAAEILPMEIRRQNNKANRSTGKISARVWADLLAGARSMRPALPPHCSIFIFPCGLLDELTMTTR